MTWHPADNRYETMRYNRCGRSGLKLPAISLGLWHNFGEDTPHRTKRAICQKAFDLGITHFDLANNYGPPPGSAEENFGRILKTDFAGLRDEIVISTKAGYRMWPGPYGEWGSRKYLLASLDQSLKRLGIDYVDIFYSHRVDPDTPLDETLGALETLVRQGKAIYAGVSNYRDPYFTDAVQLCRARGWAPITIHQPCYNLIDRDIASDVLPTAERLGVGVIAFCPLAQGLLTGRYLDGIPPGSRAAQAGEWIRQRLTPEMLVRLRALDVIAKRRGQTLSQMALAWLLRDPRVTSVLIGASSVEQLEENVACRDNAAFSDDELAEIDGACLGTTPTARKSSTSSRRTRSQS